MASNNTVANPTYTKIPLNPKGYSSFEDFYPFYLGEHANKICRRLHVVGTAVYVAAWIRVLLSLIPPSLTHFRQIIEPAKLNFLRIGGGNRARFRLLLFAAFHGYTLAWIGHFFFEHNKPATLKHPIYSLMGDFKLLYEIAKRRRNF